MKALFIFMLFMPMMPFASDVKICGQFEDNGDSFQIIDGKINPYVDGGNQPPHDPNGVQVQIFADKPWGKRYCVTGTVQAFARGNEIAFKFVSLVSAKAD